MRGIGLPSARVVPRRNPADRRRAGSDQRATQTRNRGVSGQHDNRPTFDLRKLTPPNLATRRKDSHDAPTASRNEARSPTRRARRAGARRRRHRQHRSPPPAAGPTGRRALRRSAPNPRAPNARVAHPPARPRQRRTKSAPVPCHYCTTDVAYQGMRSPSDRSTKPRCVARDHPCHPAEAANSSHSPGTPRSPTAPSGLNARSVPVTRSRTVRVTTTSRSPA